MLSEGYGEKIWGENDVCKDVLIKSVAESLTFAPSLPNRPLAFPQHGQYG